MDVPDYTGLSRASSITGRQGQRSMSGCLRRAVSAPRWGPWKVRSESLMCILLSVIMFCVYCPKILCFCFTEQYFWILYSIPFYRFLKILFSHRREQIRLQVNLLDEILSPPPPWCRAILEIKYKSEDKLSVMCMCECNALSKIKQTCIVLRFTKFCKVLANTGIVLALSHFKKMEKEPLTFMASIPDYRRASRDPALTLWNNFAFCWHHICLPFLACTHTMF